MAAGIAAVLISTTAAQAQQSCVQRELIVSKLGERYSEQLVGRGLQNDNRLFEIFVSDDGGSWTIIQSFPTGLSCIMAAGTDWLATDMAALAGAES